MYLFVYVRAYGQEKSLWESVLFLLTMWFGGSKSGCLAWQQMLSPSPQPTYIIFEATGTVVVFNNCNRNHLH